MPKNSNAVLAGATVANEPVSLDSWRSHNWCLDGPPAVTANPNASLHSLVAWCWAEADGLSGLLRGLTNVTWDGDHLAEPLVLMLSTRMQSLAAMLDHVGDLTARAERQARMEG